MSIRNNRRNYSSVGYVLILYIWIPNRQTKDSAPYDSKDSSFQSVFNFFVNAVLVC